ncbi:trypsin-like peptidase domain-containing protein [Glycomyces halotolerans]
MSNADSTPRPGGDREPPEPERAAPPPDADPARESDPQQAPETGRTHPGQPHAAAAPHMAAPGAPPFWQPSPGPGPDTAAPPPKRGRGKLVAAALALVLIAGAAGGVAGWLLSEGGPGTTVVESVSVDPGAGMTYTDIVDEVSPSVVTIVTGSAEGSGVVYSEDGYIVTNNHVVSRADTVEVRFSDGTVERAEVLATDATQDLAVVQVEDADGLTPVSFADSEEVQVGDAAVAIGSPLGLEGTVTTGIVSALDRSMTLASEDSRGQGPQSAQTLTGLIQTDAAINMGNSGGALVNGSAELIGINTAIASTESGSIGLGFAIPSNTVQDVVEQLIEHGSVERGYLGVSMADTQGNGAMILEVEPGSPAEDAGLESGDIITAIDGTRVASASEVASLVQSTASGTEVTITFMRNEEEHTTEVTLGSR